MLLLPGAQHLQNIHPLVVHFPIAYLFGSALFYGLAGLFRKGEWAKIGFWLLILGILSLGTAVASGLYAEPGVMVARSVRLNLLEPHKRFMIVTSGLGAFLAVWAVLARPLPTKGRPVFFILFFLMLLSLTWGADLGGRMVYDYNAGGNGCAQPIEFKK